MTLRAVDSTFFAAPNSGSLSLLVIEHSESRDVRVKQFFAAAFELCEHLLSCVPKALLMHAEHHLLAARQPLDRVS